MVNKPPNQAGTVMDANCRRLTKLDLMYPHRKILR
jgi:hypothetical protein